MSTDHALQVDSNKDLHGGSLYPNLPEMPAKSDRLYPDLSDLNEIRPIETPIAGVVIKVGEEGAPQTKPSTPYKQAKSSRWGLPSLSSWMGSSKKVKERIQWGKDDYPTKKEFIAAASLYYGPRIITFDPAFTPKSVLDQSQLDHDRAHSAYMRAFNQLSTVYTNRVSSLPLAERITEYNGAIDEASAPFETINKQRQVARDLRGFFLSHLLEDEGSKVSTPEELDHLMREHLIPFAATGQEQHPYVTLVRPDSGVQHFELESDPKEPKRFVRRPKMADVPDPQVEKQRVESEIRQRVEVSSTPIISGSSPATLRETLSETAEKVFQKGSTVDLNKWTAELKALHQEYRELVSDGPSPLLQVYNRLNGELISSHLKIKFDSTHITEQYKPVHLENEATLNRVKLFFNGIREAMGSEAPEILLMTQNALDYQPSIKSSYVIDDEWVKI